jgi:hypothetical protein
LRFFLLSGYLRRSQPGFARRADVRGYAWMYVDVRVFGHWNGFSAHSPWRLSGQQAVA